MREVGWAAWESRGSGVKTRQAANFSLNYLHISQPHLLRCGIKPPAGFTALKTVNPNGIPFDAKRPNETCVSVVNEGVQINYRSSFLNLARNTSDCVVYLNVSSNHLLFQTTFNK